MKYQIVPVTPFEQNCSLLWCEATRKAAVVDPGGEVETILLTHAHIDHAGATADLAERLHVPIVGPQREDRFWIQALPDQSRAFGFPPARAFEPDRWLEHGDRVELGEQTLEVLHCPGHTPGHVAFFSRADHLAVVGDILFNGSIGRTDFPRGNFQDLVRSVRERLFPLGDEVAFIPGHGPMSTFGEERRHNPFVGDGAAR